MELRDFRDWLERYENSLAGAGHTWRSPDCSRPTPPTGTSPFADQVEGLEAIEAMWERERDGPDDVFAMRSAELIAVEGSHRRRPGRASTTTSPAVQSYRDLWVIELREDGRARAFEEWPFWPPGSKGEWRTKD